MIDVPLYPYTVTDLRNWLEAQPEGAIIGAISDPCICLLAHAIAANEGMDTDHGEIVVHPAQSELVIYHSSRQHPYTPYRLDPALAEVGNEFDNLEGGDRSAVTASRALTLLNSLQGGPQ